MTLVPASPWHSDQEAWDRVSLADRLWPGLAAVEVQRANKWDSKKAKGSHGQEREFSGVDAAKVHIKIRFWTEAHWTEIRDELLPLVEPNAEKIKVDSITIGHAVAAARKVARITVDTIRGPVIGSDGVGEIDIDATEYRAPATKNATGTASGKAGGGGSPKPGSVCYQLAEQMKFLQAKQASLLAKQAETLALRQEKGVWITYPIYDSALADIQTDLTVTQAEIQATADRQIQNGCGNALASSNPQVVGPDGPPAFAGGSDS